jgi:hypothetical protein
MDKSWNPYHKKGGGGGGETNQGHDAFGVCVERPQNDQGTLHLVLSCSSHTRTHNLIRCVFNRVHTQLYNHIRNSNDTMSIEKQALHVRVLSTSAFRMTG